MFLDVIGIQYLLCVLQNYSEYLFDNYDDVIMDSMLSQITSLTIVYSAVYSGADQRKHQSSASLAFVWGIHRVPGEFPAQMASNAENVSIWWRHHVCEGHHTLPHCLELSSDGARTRYASMQYPPVSHSGGWGVIYGPQLLLLTPEIMHKIVLILLQKSAKKRIYQNIPTSEQDYYFYRNWKSSDASL